MNIQILSFFILYKFFFTSPLYTHFFFLFLLNTLICKCFFFTSLTYSKMEKGGGGGGENRESLKLLLLVLCVWNFADFSTFRLLSPLSSFPFQNNGTRKFIVGPLLLLPHRRESAKRKGKNLILCNVCRHTQR